jgi:hypothetical protein
MGSGGRVVLAGFPGVSRVAPCDRRVVPDPSARGLPHRVRTFNTTGPYEPDRHYMLPPADRLPDLQPLMVVFDVRPDRSWEDRLWTEQHAVGGKPVVVLGA